MRRFKNLPVEDNVKIKIYGKPKEYSVNLLLSAGQATYPNMKELHKVVDEQDED